MVRMNWDAVGERYFESGVDRGVFFPVGGGATVPWNGLISVDEKVSGGEKSSYYFDGNKYLDIIAGEDFAADITAFSAPATFYECEGNIALAAGLFATNQPRRTFNFAYRTRIGSDTNQDLGYKLHLVWNCTASPNEKGHKSQGGTPTPDILKYTIDSVPVIGAGNFKPTAHLTVDSRFANSTKLTNLENYLYGSASLTPTFPTQAYVISTLA